MDSRYASYGTGGSPSTRGARSRLPEKSTRDEGAYYAVNNRRTLNDPTLDGRFLGDDEEASQRSYGSVSHLSTRRGFREASPQMSDRDRPWDTRSSRSRNDQWEVYRPDQFQPFSRAPPRPQYQAPPPSYGYSRHSKSRRSAGGTVPFDSLEGDRAEILWKLGRLNSHISRLKETEQRVPSGSRAMVTADSYNAQFRQYDRDMVDPYGQDTMRPTSRYNHHPWTGRFMGEQVGYNNRPEPLDQYPQDEFAPYSIPGSRKLPDDRFRHDGNLLQLRHVGHDPVEYRTGHQIQIQEIQSVKSSPSNSRSLGQAHGKRKHCLAIAGGAPFLICSNCLNLLVLPRWLRNKEKNMDRVKCASCSTMIFLQFEEKRLTICITESTQEEEDGQRDSSSILNKEGNTQSLGLSDIGVVKPRDDSEHDLSRTNPKESAISREQGVDEVRNENKMVVGISSSHLEEDQEHEEEMENQQSYKGVILRRNDQAPPSLNSASMIAYESQQDDEKASKDTNQQKAILHKDDSDITELEVSVNEYAFTSLSIESVDTTKEEDRPKNKKGESGSFHGPMNRSIREQMMHEPIFENLGPDVTINGHPIPEDLVKQAEVHAGPILPGDYWYDYNAGFWGVMKHPCLGIILPRIKEFKYPLPANCSRGKTGIFINGRQLHDDDLKLLANRGLPMKRHRYYIVDIFGKVIDEDTGQEVCDLGILAPTIVEPPATDDVSRPADENSPTPVDDKVEKPIEVYHDKEYKSRRWHFPTYNLTISVIWSPFLVRADIFEDYNGVSTSEVKLYLDELDPEWTNMYQNLDYMIISTGKWFIKPTIYYEDRTIVGCHKCDPKRNLTELEFDFAYEKTLQVVLNFIANSHHKGLIFFRTSTPDHFENGEWHNGGTCRRTSPVKEGEVELKPFSRILRDIELREYEKARKEAEKKGLKLKLLDFTNLSLLRPDGHPGPYRHFQPFAKDKNATVQNDCLHWCMPGPIDSWNDIIIEMVMNA
ncbi:hypothetical protein SAY87_024823 [Trapa incisa]|uniref:Zinc-ribbon domain-containing protein n=1 Tax=Trapa incisa TaxID=236973 RepID=A0AAN7JG26_9MYRT|nr:hypothetical protein SAY87_024823 [Trapa incisa]